MQSVAFFRRAKLTGKRLFDVVVAVVALVVASPVCLVVSIMVLVSMGTPILFKQVRVGLAGKPFRIIKFRTMRAAQQPAPSVTADSDPRITPVGHWLRKTKLDELPQLVNVLRGEMSLVGPRPEVPEYLEYYPEDLRAVVLSVRPGITDPAAIKFRDESEILASVAPSQVVETYVNDVLPEKIRHYVAYVQSRSFIGDLAILARTAKVLVLGEGFGSTRKTGA